MLESFGRRLCTRLSTSSAVVLQKGYVARCCYPCDLAALPTTTGQTTEQRPTLKGISAGGKPSPTAIRWASVSVPSQAGCCESSRDGISESSQVWGLDSCWLPSYPAISAGLLDLGQLATPPGRTDGLLQHDSWMGNDACELDEWGLANHLKPATTANAFVRRPSDDYSHSDPPSDARASFIERRLWFHEAPLLPSRELGKDPSQSSASLNIRGIPRLPIH